MSRRSVSQKFKLRHHPTAVTSILWIAPSYHRAVIKAGGESAPSCLDLLDSRTWRLSRPNSGCPQDTTAPSVRMAANARLVAWICWTPTNCPRTWLLSPPNSGCPQLTTVPSARMAANARLVAWICSRPRSATSHYRAVGKDV